MEPESQQKIVRIIELGIEQISAQRDELKAENKRLREALDAAEKVVDAAEKIRAEIECA